MAVTSPLLQLAIGPKTQADRDRLRLGIEKLRTEDPTIYMHADEQTGRVIVGGTSDVNLEIVLDRLKREFDVNASVGKLQVAYKETLTRQADGEGRFVRQTGGRGHYAHVQVRVYPADRGAGYAFKNTVVGGTIPSQHVTSIEEGITEALARGVLAGYPIDDVTIELYDGSYHETDSSAMAFKIAAAMALHDAATKASPVLLEPIMRVDVTAPYEFVKSVNNSLAERRARIESHEIGDDAYAVRAVVPLSQMLGYRSALHSHTRQHGRYSMRFDRYEVVPGNPDDDDYTSSIGAPRKPAPRRRDSSIALPEPDDGV